MICQMVRLKYRVPKVPGGEPLLIVVAFDILILITKI